MATTDNDHYQLKLGYTSSHQLALDAVPRGSAVLDLGSGPGGLAPALMERGCKVTAVDRTPPGQVPDGVQVVVQDLDDPPRFDARSADVILLLDIIEHLKDPEAFLHRLRLQLDHRPRKLILTTPNVAFAAQRAMLLLGQFNYGKSGILDLTHTRLFTRSTIRSLLRDEGFRVQHIRGIPAPFPRALGDTPLARGLLRLNELLIAAWPQLFSYQFMVVAETTPDISFIVAETRQTSSPHAHTPGGVPGGTVGETG